MTNCSKIANRFIPRALIIATLTIFLFSACSDGGRKKQDSSPQELYKHINTERENNSKQNLEYNLELEQVASNYANLLMSLLVEDYSDNEDGLTIEQRLNNAAVSFTTAEQVGFFIEDDGSPSTALNELISNFNSILLNENFTDIGIATVNWQ